jgi:hypothetical protein
VGEELASSARVEQKMNGKWPLLVHCGSITIVPESMVGQFFFLRASMVESEQKMKSVGVVEAVDAKINTLESEDKCSPSHGKSTKRASQFDLKLTREETKSNSRAYRLGFRISLRWAYQQALPIL